MKPLRETRFLWRWNYSPAHSSHLACVALSRRVCRAVLGTQDGASSWGRASLYFRACVGAWVFWQHQPTWWVAGTWEPDPVLEGMWTLEHRAGPIHPGGQPRC